MMGIREYARHRAAAGLPGATHRAVQVAITTGRLVASLTSDGKRIRSAKKADAEWASSTKSEMAPLTGPTAAKNGNGRGNGQERPNALASARARRESAIARLAEIELAEKEGELILAKDVEARLADVFLQCRGRLLGIPTRARQQDPTLTEPQLALVEALLHEALEDLAVGGRE